MTTWNELVALVWRRTPANLKVTASETRYVAKGGKLVPLESLTADELFTTLRRVATMKSLLNSLEAA